MIMDGKYIIVFPHSVDKIERNVCYSVEQHILVMTKPESTSHHMLPYWAAFSTLPATQYPGSRSLSVLSGIFWAKQLIKQEENVCHGRKCGGGSDKTEYGRRFKPKVLSKVTFKIFQGQGLTHSSIKIALPPLFRYSTPLHDAVCCSRQEIVQILVERGANVNELDYKNTTPLKLAVRQGNTHMHTAVTCMSPLALSGMVRRILRSC
jgi:hypothetical protein